MLFSGTLWDLSPSLSLSLSLSLSTIPVAVFVLAPGLGLVTISTIVIAVRGNHHRRLQIIILATSVNHRWFVGCGGGG